MSRVERVAWGTGAAGLLASALGWWLQPGELYFGWLAVLVVWCGWPIGSMGLLLIHALTGGRWGNAVRPGLLHGTATLPLVVPALLPLLPGLRELYPWMRPDIAAGLANRFYLNHSFFIARQAAYLVIWLAIAALILRGMPLRRLAPPALILLALTVTFSAIDWTMSLDPDFESSAYGMITGTGMVLTALSIAILLGGLTAEPEIVADLGKLLLALIVLWTYLDFMQLLIVWQSDLADEAPWYVRRMHGFWGGVMAVTALVHFFLPFFLLIFPQIQRSRRGVAAVAALLVAAAMLRGWWTVLPAVPRGLDWIDLACLCGFGGIGLGLTLRTRPILLREAPTLLEDRDG